MATTLPETTTLSNFAQLWDRLGNVPLERISIHPAPGTATVDDVLRGRHRKGQKHLYELVHGVLVEKDMGHVESRLAIWLSFYLCSYLKEHPLGVIAGADGPHVTIPDHVRYPDVGFTSHERIPPDAAGQAVMPVAPDLAVEIISAGNTPAEMQQKLEEYFEAGTRLVWYVDPAPRTVRVFTTAEDQVTLTESDTLHGEPVLPGFRLSIREWFEQAQ